MDSKKRNDSYDLFKNSKKQEKANWNIRPYLAVALLAFIVFCLCITVFFVIYRFEGVKSGWNKITSVLQPITIGMVLAYLLNPVMKFIERNMGKLLKKRVADDKKRAKICRVTGTFGALLFFLLLVFVLLELLIPQLIKSISGFAANLPDQMDSLYKWFDNIAKEGNQTAAIVEEGIRQASDYLDSWVNTSLLPDLQTYVAGFTSGVINVVRSLLNVVVGLIIAVYVLLSKEKFVGQFKKIIYAFLPARPANVIIQTIRKSNQIFGGFISGKILDSAIIGVLCYIILSIMQMPYTILVSVIVGMTNVVPFFGPFIGAIPGTIIIMLANPIQGLYFVIVIFLLQQLDGNIIGPKILGDSTGLSSFWVVFAILVGGGLFGFAGMLLGVPVFAVIYYIMSKIVSYILRKKKMPEDTASYISASSVNTATNNVEYEKK